MVMAGQKHRKREVGVAAAGRLQIVTAGRCLRLFDAKDLNQPRCGCTRLTGRAPCDL